MIAVYIKYDPLVEIIAKCVWISSIAFVLFALTRYLGDLYNNLLLMRDLESQLDDAQTNLDEAIIQKTFVSTLEKSFGYSTVNLFYIERDTNGDPCLNCVEVSSNQHQALKLERFPMSFGIIGYVASSGIRYIDNNVNDQRKQTLYRPYPLFPKTKSELVVPLKIKDTVFGVLDVQLDRPNMFSEEDAITVESAVQRFTAVLHSTQLARHVGELFHSTYEQVRLEENLVSTLQKLANSAIQHLEADLVMIYYQVGSSVNGPIFSGESASLDSVFDSKTYESPSFIHSLLNDANLPEIIVDEDVRKPTFPFHFSEKHLSESSFIAQQGIKSRVIIRLNIDDKQRILIFLNYRKERLFNSEKTDWWQINQLLINEYPQLAHVAVANVLKRDATLNKQKLQASKCLHNTVLSALDRTMTLSDRLSAEDCMSDEARKIVDYIYEIVADTYEAVEYFENHFRQQPAAQLKREIDKLAQQLREANIDFQTNWQFDYQPRISNDVVTTLRDILREATTNAIRHGEW